MSFYRHTQLHHTCHRRIFFPLCWNVLPLKSPFIIPKDYLGSYVAYVCDMLGHKRWLLPFLLTLVAGGTLRDSEAQMVSSSLLLLLCFPLPAEAGSSVYAPKHGGGWCLQAKVAYQKWQITGINSKTSPAYSNNAEKNVSKRSTCYEIKRDFREGC